MIDKNEMGKRMYMLWAKTYGERTGISTVFPWEENDADQQAAWVAVAESVTSGLSAGIAAAIAAMKAGGLK